MEFSNMLSWIKDHIGSPTTVIFLGTILTALGALWASMQQSESEKSLRKKSDEIAELNKRMFNSITGGDSYCIILVLLDSADQNKAVFLLQPKGKYPNYDVSLKIVDVQKKERFEKLPQTLQVISNFEQSISIGNVPPNRGQTFLEIDLPDTDKQDYVVFISARNGIIVQTIHLRRIENKWKQALLAHRVTDVGSESDSTLKEKPLFEYIDQGYHLKKVEQTKQ